MTPCQITFENAVIIKDCSIGKRVGKKASELLLAPYQVNCLHISAYSIMMNAVVSTLLRECLSSRGDSARPLWSRYS